MTIHSDRHIGTERSGVGLGPGPLWWVAHAIGGFGIGSLFLAWGLVVLSRGEAWIPFGRGGGLTLHGTSATLFGWAVVAICPGLVAHMFLSCFERFKHVAQMGAKLAAGVALLLFVGAFVHHLVVV